MTASWSAIDLIAAIYFLVTWLGYAPFLRWIATRRKLVGAAMVNMRLAWMLAMLDRDMRVSDASLIGHVMSSVSFFASTTVIIIAGLIGILGNMEARAQSVANEATWWLTRSPLEIKVALVLIVMIYAFQTFAWSIRQLAYSLVLIGAAPPKPVEPVVRSNYASNVAAVITQGAQAYDNGIRAYHFALGGVTCIAGPISLIDATTAVLVLLWTRQSKSRTALALQQIVHPPAK